MLVQTSGVGSLAALAASGPKFVAANGHEFQEIDGYFVDLTTQSAYRTWQDTGLPAPGAVAPNAQAAPPMPTFPQPTISISNVSRPGQQIQVGDRFRVVIKSGQASSAVYVLGTHDGVIQGSPLNPVRMGTTDGQGTYVYEAVAQPSELGAWQESWLVQTQFANGGVGNNVSLSFTIYPAQQQQQTQTQTNNSQAYNPRAFFSNLTRPGQSLQVGDQWLLEITGGRPNATVSASSTQNGASRGTTSYGSTDGTGGFHMSGTIAPEHTGNWLQTWFTGPDAAAPIQWTAAASSQQQSTNTAVTTPISEIIGGFSQTPTGDSSGLVPSSTADSTIPNWAWYAAAAAAAAYFMAKDR